MILSVGSIFAEVGVNFEISHKVDLFIRSLIIKKIMVPYALDKQNKETLLSFIVSTSSKTMNAEVRGPDCDKRNNAITWTLWLPYKEITKAQDPLRPYIKYYFQAASEVFQHYGVDPKKVLDLQELAENEILNNPDYVFDEESIPEPDLSDILDDINK